MRCWTFSGVSLFAVAVFAVAVFAVAATAVAAEPAAAPPERQGGGPAYLRWIEARRTDSGEVLAAVEKVLYGYSDQARGVSDGAILAWGGSGRPVAMAKSWVNRNGTRTFAFSLVSNELI